MNWYKQSQYEDFNNAPKQWAGQTLYHGTSKESADDIVANGVDMSKSTKGYFGKGFYMAEQKDLAQSNYADFAEDEEEESAGVVLEMAISPTANILDLRDSGSFDIWQKVSQMGNLLGRDDFDKIAIRNGIDGVYDNSFGGVVVYNPNVLKVTE